MEAAANPRGKLQPVCTHDGSLGERGRAPESGVRPVAVLRDPIRRSVSALELP